MKTKISARLALAAFLLVGALGAHPASATTDGVWDYRTTSVGGTFKPLVGYFNNDGSSDILWYAAGNAPDSLWLSGARGTFTKSSLTITGTFTPLLGNFGGDGRTDILWYAAGAAPDSLWIADDSPAHFAKKSLTINGTFKPTVIGDFTTQSSKDDILWYTPGAGGDSIWHFADDDSGTYVSKSTSITGSFQIVTGRYNADGIEDLVLYGYGTAADALWLSNPDGTFTKKTLSVNGKYLPVHVFRDAPTDGIYWYGSGAASDAMSNGTTAGGLSSVKTGQIPYVCLPIAGATNSTMLYCPDNPEVWVDDTNSTSNLFYVSTTRNQGHGFQPFLGDFDNDGWVDIFWYAPGSQGDEIWYGVPASPAGGRSAHGRTFAPRGPLGR